MDYGKQMQTLEVVADMRDRHFGIIMTTHDPNHVFITGDQVAIMDGTGFAAMGTPDEVITESALKSLYNLEVKLVTSEDCGDRKICVPIKNKK